MSRGLKNPRDFSQGYEGKGKGMDIQTLQNPYPSPGVQGFEKSSG